MDSADRGLFPTLCSPLPSGEARLRPQKPKLQTRTRATDKVGSRSSLGESGRARVRKENSRSSAKGVTKPGRSFSPAPRPTSGCKRRRRRDRSARQDEQLNKSLSSLLDTQDFSCNDSFNLTCKGATLIAPFQNQSVAKNAKQNLILAVTSKQNGPTPWSSKSDGLTCTHLDLYLWSGHGGKDEVLWHLWN